MGTGIGHYIPQIAYFGFWIMCLVSLSGRPLYGLYYVMPFLPYRTMREHFYELPLGTNVVTILVACIILGALFKGKSLPKSTLYLTWLLFGAYLYFSMWIGTALGNEPAPLWITDSNFSTWKDYMIMPLLFIAAGLVIEDRKAVRTVVLITAISLFLVDKSALAESLSHSWSVFDENKRSSGPIAYGPNQLAAYLAQFGMFFWGFGHIMKRKKVKLLCYALVGLTIVTTMYTFSRGAYLALIGSALVLGLVKDRKLLVIVGIFLFTWQTIVPKAVTERVSMTHDANGQLEESAEERVILWQQSQAMFLSSPLVGTGFASFQYGEHTGNLKDTHNWYVKVLVESGLIGGLFAFAILGQLVASSFRLFRKAEDPLYRGLGLGFLLCIVSCAIANCFGDRWTYVEINGILWILVGANARALQFVAEAPETGLDLTPGLTATPAASLAPHLEWR